MVLGERLGIVSTGVIPLWESGKKGMEKAVLKKLCAFFKAGCWEFYIEAETPIIKDKEEGGLLNLIRTVPELKSQVIEFAQAMARFKGVAGDSEGEGSTFKNKVPRRCSRRRGHLKARRKRGARRV